jgi:hypothetical protein
MIHASIRGIDRHVKSGKYVMSVREAITKVASDISLGVDGKSAALEQ